MVTSLNVKRYRRRRRRHHCCLYNDSLGLAVCLSSTLRFAWAYCIFVSGQPSPPSPSAPPPSSYTGHRSYINAKQQATDVTPTEQDAIVEHTGQSDVLERLSSMRRRNTLWRKFGYRWVSCDSNACDKSAAC